MLLLTAAELIERHFTGSKRISVDKLYRMAKKKLIPCVWLDGRVYFPEEEFCAWVQAESRVGTSAAEMLKPYGRDKQKGRLRVINE